jgi:DNA-binding transcriptional MerR regulator
MDDFYTTKELAKLLKVSSQTLENWRKKNIGPPALNFNGIFRYQKEDVKNYIERLKK